MEPGPGLEWKPFTLKVLDPSGKQTAAAEVRKRQTLQLSLPAGASEIEYRLHVDAGGKSAPNDPRILNFRVFSIAAVRR